VSPELIERFSHHSRNVDIRVVDTNAIQPYLIVGEWSNTAGTPI
jgi:hypothetical protein